jgi:hypothetical protein
MKYIVLILTFISTTAFAQDDEPAIKSAVSKLFEGMRKSDTATMRTVFSSNSILQTIIKNKDGQTGIETEPLDSLLVSVAVPHTEVYDERITFDIIKIDGELAMVWAHYKFYVGARPNHCGVDSFQLVKINGEWKIQYLIDTRRRQDASNYLALRRYFLFTFGLLK